MLVLQIANGTTHAFPRAPVEIRMEAALRRVWWDEFAAIGLLILWLAFVSADGVISYAKPMMVVPPPLP